MFKNGTIKAADSIRIQSFRKCNSKEKNSWNWASKHAGRSHHALVPIDSNWFETILLPRYSSNTRRLFFFRALAGFSSFSRAEDHLLFKEKAFPRREIRNPTVTLRMGYRNTFPSFNVCDFQFYFTAETLFLPILRETISNHFYWILFMEFESFI